MPGTAAAALPRQGGFPEAQGAAPRDRAAVLGATRTWWCCATSSSATSPSERAGAAGGVVTEGRRHTQDG